MLRISRFRSGNNENYTYTSQQYALSQKLTEILASVGNDLVQAEPLVIKAGYGQDSTGAWFAKVGNDMVVVPTPAVLQPAPLARRWNPTR